MTCLKFEVFGFAVFIALLVLPNTLAAQNCDNLAGVECRCVSLAANCICSEPMNVDDPNAGDGWIPADSAGLATRCAGKQYGAFLFSDSPASLINTVPVDGLIAGNPNAQRFGLRTVGQPTWVLLGREYARSTERRMCTRWYMRVDHDWSGATNNPNCPTERNKIFDVTFQGSGANFQMEEAIWKSTCSGPGNYSPFMMSARGFPEGDIAATLQPASFTWDECRKDASGRGGWCRFEVCTHGDLSSAGSVSISARVYSLRSGNSTEIIGLGPYPTQGPQEQYHVNIFHGQGTGAIGGWEVAHYLSASWPTDSGQWIGAACEIEDGCSAPGPDTAAPAAPANMRVLQ